MLRGIKAEVYRGEGEAGGGKGRCGGRKAMCLTGVRYFCIQIVIRIFLTHLSRDRAFDTSSLGLDVSLIVLSMTMTMVHTDVYLYFCRSCLIGVLGVSSTE